MKNQFGGILLELFIVIVGLLGVGGWVWNIIKIVHDFAMPVTGLLIVRIIGVFMAPLGAVLGYF